MSGWRLGLSPLAVPTLLRLLRKPPAGKSVEAAESMNSLGNGARTDLSQQVRSTLRWPFCGHNRNEGAIKSMIVNCEMLSINQSLRLMSE